MKCWSTMTAETERDQLMRKAQISIRMEIFGDQAANGHSEEIIVYADANNVYENTTLGMCCPLLLTMSRRKRGNILLFHDGEVKNVGQGYSGCNRSTI